VIAPIKGGKVSDQSFEDEYLEVLQNIEFNIVQIAQEHPEMTDWDALSAVEALIAAYRKKSAGRQATPPKLSPLAKEAYAVLNAMCNWRLGEGQLLNEEDEPVDIPRDPITADEMLACLKRIRLSINRWTKQGGRRGYLTFIDQFLPHIVEE
jgi:hypothetical protein